MEESAAAKALDHARTCGEMIAYAASRRAAAIRLAVASGLQEAEVAAALGVPLSAVRDALQPG